ncbi:phosphoribosyltransferase-like protein [Escherichia coli]|uniref:phosphoribosyltransferase-like protein n=1 Tax=Escherichia coli TaxID=562 RepID=UPI0034E4B29A
MSSHEITLDKTKRATLWLEQFDEDDRPYANLLLKKIHWVSSYEFEKTIKNEVENIGNESEHAIAIFVEREVLPEERVYKFSDKKPQRADGEAFEPINIIKNRKEIGSEGLLNTIATNISRSDSRKYLYYPAANVFRKKKIRKVVILTDTIGSGNQMYSFLDCFQKTPSLKSWYSSHHIKFFVVCYAATQEGLKRMEYHPFKPTIIYNKICPTIENSFSGDEKKKITFLCHKYNPDQNKNSPFGYGGVAALICYSHGMPNNAPAILYKRSNSWKPLFRNRTAIDLKDELPTGDADYDPENYLNLMNQKRITASAKFQKLNDEGKKYILVLLSLRRLPRTKNAIASRSGLSSRIVSDILVRLTFLGWIDDNYRLTDEGQLLIEELRKKGKAKELPKQIKEGYYPTTLRRP